MKTNLLLFAVLLSLTTSMAQTVKKTIPAPHKQAATVKPPAPTESKPEVITDAFSYGIKGALTQMLALANNPKLPGSAFAAAYINTEQFRCIIYKPVVECMSGSETTLKREYPSRAKGTVQWTWHTVLYDQPKTYGIDEPNRLKAKADSIIAIVNPTGKHNIQTSCWGTGTDEYSKNHVKNYTLNLYMHIVKPFENTEQQALDSLARLYKPGFATWQTAQNAAKKYSLALQAEGISEAKTESILIEELKKAAGKDMRIAYAIIMGVDGDIGAYLALLTPEQKAKLQTIAQDAVNAFYEKREFDINATLGTPVSPKLIAVKQGNKWGVKDNQGQMLVSPKYDAVGILSDGMIAVGLGNKCGFINEQGQEVVYPKYKSAANFNGGLAKVSFVGLLSGRKEQWGYINKSGQEVIPLIYDSASDFFNGKAYISKDGKSYEVDKSGRTTELKGTGNTATTVCTRCHGTGEWRHVYDGIYNKVTYTMKCPDCGGTGYVKSSK